MGWVSLGERERGSITFNVAPVLAVEDMTVSLVCPGTRTCRAWPWPLVVALLAPAGAAVTAAVDLRRLT